MYKILSIVLLLSAFPGRPQTTRYYHYDGKPLSLEEKLFKRYAIPQVRAMLLEYDSILHQLHPKHSALVAIRHQVENMEKLWRATKVPCLLKQIASCSANYGQLYQMAGKLDKELLAFQQNNTGLSGSKDEETIGLLVNLITEVDSMAIANFELFHHLKMSIATFGVQADTYYRTDKNIAPLFNRMRPSAYAITTAYLPGKNRELFDFVWSNFFVKLYRYVLIEEDREYLLRHLGELNAAWNAFNMNLVKSQQKYPNNVEELVFIMHDRWNSVLKMILTK